MPSEQVEASPHPENTELPLREVIRELILRSGGAISFAEFMEHALYHPQWGYYAREGRRTGREGDFYTSVSVGVAFGEILGHALEDRWRQSGEPEAFHWVEQGAHDGQLTTDVLESLARRRSPVAARIRAWVVEPLPGRAEILRRRFGVAVSVVADLAEVLAPVGVFFCNELLDAFPVRVVIAHRGRWRERAITWPEGAGTLAWVERDLPQEVEAEAALALGLPEPEGRVSEICPTRSEWVGQAARLFPGGGWWWVFDYGEASGARGETLRGYLEHRRATDLLGDPGRMDLTADVDFARLAVEAGAAGLEVRPLRDQHDFLTREGIPWLLSLEKAVDEAQGVRSDMAARIRQFRTLTHPGMMGRLFKVSEWRRL